MLPGCEEDVRRGYDRDAFGQDCSSLEDEIIASRARVGSTQVYTPWCLHPLRHPLRRPGRT